MDTIGIVCEPDQPVFGRVAERLAARGFDVEFLAPRGPVDRGTIDELAALVNTVVNWRSFATLRYADATGVETWNGFLPTTALSCRLVALNALERLGCHVPPTGPSAGDGRERKTARFRWDGQLDRGRDLFDTQFRSEPLTYRYYAVDDGVETHVQALTIRWKLTDRRSILGETDVDVALATRVRELLDRFDARSVAVDFVRTDGEFYAVDVDPTPRFHGSGMERRVADSVASLTTIGA